MLRVTQIANDLLILEVRYKILNFPDPLIKFVLVPSNKYNADIHPSKSKCKGKANSLSGPSNNRIDIVSVSILEIFLIDQLPISQMFRHPLPQPILTIYNSG